MAKLKQRGVSRHVINPPKTSRRSFHRQSHHIKRKITNTNGRDQGECGGGESGSEEKGREKGNWGEGKTAFRSGAEGPSTRPSCPATAALLFFCFVFFIMQEIITIMIKHLPDKIHLTSKNQPRIAVLMIFDFFFF